MQKITLSTAKEAVKLAITSKIVPFLVSKPGIGKSAIVRQIAEQFDLQFIDVRLASMQPEDLNGFPVVLDNKAQYVNFTNTFPVKSSQLPENKKGWLILLDELPSASQSVKVAAYKLLLDRELGNNEKLNDLVYMVAAGNGTDDGAIAEELGTALTSRVIPLNIVYSQKELLDYFTKIKANEFIITYLEQNPSDGYGVQKDTDEPFATPRTWEFLNTILNNKYFSKKLEKSENKYLTTEAFRATVAGLLGDTIGAKFCEHIIFSLNIPSYAKLTKTNTVNLVNLNVNCLSHLKTSIVKNIKGDIEVCENGDKALIKAFGDKLDNLRTNLKTLVVNKTFMESLASEFMLLLSEKELDKQLQNNDTEVTAYSLLDDFLYH